MADPVVQPLLVVGHLGRQRAAQALYSGYHLAAGHIVMFDSSRAPPVSRQHQKEAHLSSRQSGHFLAESIHNLLTALVRLGMKVIMFLLPNSTVLRFGTTFWRTTRLGLHQRSARTSPLGKELQTIAALHNIIMTTKHT